MPQRAQPAYAAVGCLDARHRPDIHKEQFRHQGDRSDAIELLRQQVLRPVDEVNFQVGLVIQPKLRPVRVAEHGDARGNDRRQIPASRRPHLEDVVGELLFQAESRQDGPALLRTERSETGREPHLVLQIRDIGGSQIRVARHNRRVDLV